MSSNPDRNTPEIEGTFFCFPVKANVVIPTGVIVQLDDAGMAQPGTQGSGLICVGRAESRVEGGETDGASRITVKRGVFRYENAGDITAADINGPCYVHGEATVANANSNPDRSLCGVVMGVEPEGVWVRI